MPVNKRVRLENVGGGGDEVLGSCQKHRTTSHYQVAIATLLVH